MSPAVVHAALIDLLHRTRLIAEYAPEEVAAHWRDEQAEVRARTRQAHRRLTELQTQQQKATVNIRRPR